MPSCLAVAWALARSRDAIAVISQSAPRCMAGSTFATPILAVLRTPQRILVMICSFAEYVAVRAIILDRDRSPFLIYRCYHVMWVEHFAIACVYFVAVFNQWWGLGRLASLRYPTSCSGFA